MPAGVGLPIRDPGATVCPSPGNIEHIAVEVRAALAILENGASLKSCRVILQNRTHPGRHVDPAPGIGFRCGEPAPGNIFCDVKFFVVVIIPGQGAGFTWPQSTTE